LAAGCRPALRRLEELDDQDHAGRHEQQEQHEECDDGDGSHPMGDDSGTMTRSITYVTRKGCTLCEEAFPGVQRWAERLGLTIALVDVDESPALHEVFDHRVPVVLSEEGDVLLEGRWGSIREARMMLRARYG
jgi:hypothetical protein